MLVLDNDISIKCDKCGKIFKVQRSDISFDCDTYDDHGENGMGCEYKYSYEEKIQCEHCDNLIELEIVSYEYPLGCKSCEDELNISGGEFVNRPNIIIPLEE